MIGQETSLHAAYLSPHYVSFVSNLTPGLCLDVPRIGSASSSALSCL